MSDVASENLKDVITKTPLTFFSDADTALLNTQLDHARVLRQVEEVSIRRLS
ncbi:MULTISPECIES: hypothetical protein [Agrobacterium]|jgi:hypothetical protein|uniref:hypothetical protein n=1 Tax=Agrobacterium TaxID=357 RepID=UPI0022B82C54|nr:MULTISPECIES: hypothetical protein [Agrobacterium]MCZ7889063.1 hypothetical protein [Agrobacterium salinitolerans]MDA5628201.1 hypothetical protein [Agrobacterium sp. ST15.16.055]MDA6978053.1 hypothetical protein [Agrobacterium salinitolerans]